MKKLIPLLQKYAALSGEMLQLDKQLDALNAKSGKVADTRDETLIDIRDESTRLPAYAEGQPMAKYVALVSKAVAEVTGAEEGKEAAVFAKLSKPGGPLSMSSWVKMASVQSAFEKKAKAADAKAKADAKKAEAKAKADEKKAKADEAKAAKQAKVIAAKNAKLKAKLVKTNIVKDKGIIEKLRDGETPAKGEVETEVKVEVETKTEQALPPAEPTAVSPADAP